MADHIDIGRAEHLLAGGDSGKRRAGLPEEVGLEGNHAGTGEQQSRIAERDQGGARQHLVVPLFEEVEKTLADVRARHVWPARSVSWRPSSSRGEGPVDSNGMVRCAGLASIAASTSSG